jgi:hypothetical protein
MWMMLFIAAMANRANFGRDLDPKVPGIESTIHLSG